MKKLVLSIVCTLICYLASYGQVSLYTFSSSAGTYTPLAGGSPLIPPNSGISGNGWFEQTYNVPLPFVYYFNGKGYSSIYINSNGYVTFAKPELVTNPRPYVVNSGVAGSIMGLGCGVTYAFNGGAGSVLLGNLIDNANANPIMYGTIGSAPNRIFVIQWTNAVRTVTYYGSNGTGVESVTFQIRLKETSNVAEMVYNTSTTAFSPPYNPAVGLTGASTADFNLLSGTTWSSVTNNTVSSAVTITFNSGTSIPAGTTFDFTPSPGQMPVACSGTPPAATALATTGITCSTVGLSLSGLPLTTGLTYQWQSSSTGLANSWGNIAAATNASYTASPTAATFYQCLVACGGGTQVPSSPVVVGYESTCPVMPSYSYDQSGGYPYNNIGLFSIAGGACSTTLNDVENSLSDFNYTVYGGGSGTAYSYVDYTINPSHIKLQGSTSSPQNFTATVNNYGANAGVYGVWIDLNDNGSFTDANEYVGSIGSVVGTASTFTITIPVNNFGIHRMRIRSVWNAGYNTSTITPTGFLNYWGQTNDYVVEIVPPTPAPTTNSPVCVGGTLVLTSAAITGSIYTWAGPLSYYATTTSTTQSYTVPSISAAGTYTLTTTVDGANACAPGVTIVTVNAAPSLTGASNSGPICSGNTLTLTASGASNVAGYSWTGPVAVTTATSAIATVPLATTAATGTYSVAVNNGAGSGCTITYTTTATVNPSPNVTSFSIPTATAPCQGFGSVVTVNSTSLVAGTYTVNYNLSGANTALGNTATLVIAGSTGTFTTSTLASSGSTTVTINSVTNGFGCPTPVTTGNTFIFTVNPLPSAITGTNFVCPGQTTALTDAGGGTWASGNTTLATVLSGTGVVSGVAAGTPSIIYTLPTGCITTTTVTVFPLPAAINGTTNVCVGSVTTLSDITPFGTWGSSDGTLASVDFLGNVTGVAQGLPNITYTIPSTGCFVTTPVTVNPLPAAITGNTNVCEGSTTALSDATPSGIWSSSSTTNATVSGSGVVTGVLSGILNISYTLGTGCITTTPVTVNPPPSAINGTTVVCVGSTTQLNDIDGGGNWSSSNTSLATVDGTGLVTGASAGLPTITYTLPTGCINSIPVTVNPLPAVITGTTNVCVGLTTQLTDITGSGTWSSDDILLATVSGTGIVTGISNGTPNIIYTLPTSCSVSVPLTVNPLPSAITGTNNVCVASTVSLNDTDPLGTWGSSNISFATVDVSGNVTGISAGSPNITYTLPTGCITTINITVNPLPAAITGTANVCVGLTTQLSDFTASGTWTSSDLSLAAVDNTTGIVTGISNGVPNITYTLISTGCTAILPVTVNSLPAAISGTMNVCIGLTTSLVDITGTGTWSSSNPVLAAVDITGLVTGKGAGTPNITYTLPTGCIMTTPVTVNNLPGTITGVKNVCAGSTTVLADGGGGTWFSDNLSFASIDPTGIVTGIAAGVANITYTLSTGCIATTPITVAGLPAAITGVTNVCVGSTTALTDIIPSGTWSSSDKSLAAVYYGSGLVAGISAGNPVITYTLPTGCVATIPITVNALPTPITGIMNVCAGSVTALADGGGGTWNSGNTSLATVDVSGNVTGVAAGKSDIIYTLPTGCTIAANITVNPLPAIITGTMNVCAGLTTVLNDVTSAGTWSSSNTAFAVVSGPGYVTGVSNGVANIKYTLSTGCAMSAAVVVNPLPAAITGTANVCVGSTTALSDISGPGTWTSSNISLAMVDVSGNVTGVATGTPYITYTLPTGCIAPMMVTVNPLPNAGTITGAALSCVSATNVLTTSVTGGIWSSTNPTATVSGGVVTGVATGIDTIQYSVTNICGTAVVGKTINVDVAPVAGSITGPSNVCTGAGIALADTIAGGAWSSSNAMATVSGIGHVLGVSAGTDTIIYKVSNGCGTDFTTASITINPATPDAGSIAGASDVCVGATTPLTNTVAGGAWSSSNGNVTVTGSGVVKGITANTSTIIYTISNACGSTTATKVITVDAAPAAFNVTGGGGYCPGTNGVYVGLNGSESGLVVYYTLYNGAANVVVAPGLGASFDFGLQTATGVYTVIATNRETGCTHKMSDSVTVSLLPQSACITEVKTVGQTAELKVLPNPNKGVFTITGSLGTTDDVAVSLEIMDILGQVVYKNNVTAQGGNINEKIQINNATANGMYILNVRSAAANNVFHIVIEQ